MTTEREQFEQKIERRDPRADQLLARLDRETRPVAAARDEIGDESDLVRRAQQGDEAAREALIDRLLPLVNGLARRYRTEGLDQADLLQETRSDPLPSRTGACSITNRPSGTRTWRAEW